MPSAADSDLPNQTPPETIAPTGSTSHSTAGAGLPTPIDGETSPPVEQTAGAEGDDEFLDYEPLTPELLEEEAIRGDFALRWAVVLLKWRNDEWLRQRRLAMGSRSAFAKPGILGPV